MAWRNEMRAYVVPLAAVIAAVGAGTVDAASLTVTMNAIDALSLIHI